MHNTHSIQLIGQEFTDESGCSKNDKILKIHDWNKECAENYRKTQFRTFLRVNANTRDVHYHSLLRPSVNFTCKADAKGKEMNSYKDAEQIAKLKKASIRGRS